MKISQFIKKLENFPKDADVKVRVSDGKEFYMGEPTLIEYDCTDHSVYVWEEW